MIFTIYFSLTGVLLHSGRLGWMRLTAGLLHARVPLFLTVSMAPLCLAHVITVIIGEFCVQINEAIYMTLCSR